MTLNLRTPLAKVVLFKLRRFVAEKFPELFYLHLHKVFYNKICFCLFKEGLEMKREKNSC